MIVAAVALLATGCGSSSKGTTNTTTASTGSSTTLPNQRYATNSTGTPQMGGTLTMLGTGDVDYM
ncbi:MAG: hypothetical protein ACRDZ8_05240, partial [Acidimicrobiales bacterium]